ncbi:hypothetical protein D3C81_778800 [compost metagenome]
MGQRLAIQQNLAALRRPLPGQQPHQGGLATPCLPQQRQLLAGVQLQGTASQHGAVLAGVGEVEIPYLQGALSRRRLLLSPLWRLGLLQYLVETTGRGEAGGEVLEGTRQGQQRLEAGQGGEHHQRRDGVRGATADAVTGEPQHQGQGPAAEQLHREAGEAAHPGHAGLGLDQGLLGLLQLGQRLGGGGEHLQLGMAVQVIHHAGAHGGFLGDESTTGGPAGEIEHQRQGQHAEEQYGPQGQCQAAVEEGEEEYQPGTAEQGRPYGGDEAQVDVIHGVDVGHQTVEQIRLTKTGQGAGGEGGESLPEPDPQPGEHPEGGVVAHHSLTPAAGGAHYGEEAYPAGRGHVVEGVPAGDRQPRHGGG